MESLDGMAQIARNARRTYATSLAGFKQDQANRAAASSANDVLQQAFMFKGRARGLDAVIATLKERYPSDPLFQATGRKRPNGNPELVFHTIMDKGTTASAKECPCGVPEARLMLFKQRTE